MIERMQGNVKAEWSTLVHFSQFRYAQYEDIKQGSPEVNAIPFFIANLLPYRPSYLAVAKLFVVFGNAPCIS